MCFVRSLTVHRLGARSAIRSLEMEEDAGEQKGGGASARDKVVELSVRSGVSSSHTAFVAVRQGDGAALGGPLLRRNIPVPCCKSLSHPSKPFRACFDGVQERISLLAPAFFGVRRF